MGEWKEYKLKDLLAEKGYIRGHFWFLSEK